MTGERFQSAVDCPVLPKAAPRVADRPAGKTVFQVASGWFPEHKGGAESVYHNLYRNLGHHGFRVTGLVGGTPKVEADTHRTVRSFMAKGQPLHRRALAIRRAARESFAMQKPDLITGHFALYTAPLLDMIGKTPFIVHFHGPWALESQVEGASRTSVMFKKMLEQLVYRRAQRVIVLSNAFGDIVQKHYGVDGSVVRKLPGGVDCTEFDPAETRSEARQALGWHPDRPTIFVARRLVRRMGLDRLLTAMAAVRLDPAGRDAVLRIAGSGPARVELERQIVELGLTDAVHLDGFVPDGDLALAYRAADLTLVPTAALEGFGLVAVESLAAGTPVLVTPVGGLPEVVSDLSDNLVLAGSDAGSIADGMLQFLRNPGILPDGRACQEFARRRYDWNVVTEQVADVYRELV